MLYSGYFKNDMQNLTWGFMRYDFKAYDCLSQDLLIAKSRGKNNQQPNKIKPPLDIFETFERLRFTA